MRGVRETIEESSGGARVEDEPPWTPEQVERFKGAFALGLRGLFLEGGAGDGA